MTNKYYKEKQDDMKIKHLIEIIFTNDTNTLNIPKMNNINTY